MCDATCIKEPFVQRGTVVLDCGVFVQNYAGCSACGSRAAPASSPPRCESEEDEDEIAEETEFDHRCADCGHLVATHWHRFVSGDLAVGECAEVMRDTLWILSSQEIKVSAPKPLQEEEEEAEEGAGQATAAAMKAAKGKLVDSMMKKHLVESIVPIVQGLKELLSARQSPLLGDLMACACGLFKEYKAELADILAADRQLYQEIMLDIKREEQKQRALARQGMLRARAGRSG